MPAFKTVERVSSHDDLRRQAERSWQKLPLVAKLAELVSVNPKNFFGDGRALLHFVRKSRQNELVLKNCSLSDDAVKAVTEELLGNLLAAREILVRKHGLQALATEMDREARRLTSGALVELHRDIVNDPFRFAAFGSIKNATQVRAGLGMICGEYLAEFKTDRIAGVKSGPLCATIAGIFAKTFVAMCAKEFMDKLGADCVGEVGLDIGPALRRIDDLAA